MATTITNRIGVSTIQGDTTNDAISFANLKHADEDTPVAAKIVEIFWQTAGTITIDRGGSNIHAFTGTGHWNLEAAGTCLQGTNTNDIGITVAGGDSFFVVIVRKNILRGNMKLITEMYDDFEILTEGKGKDMKIKGSLCMKRRIVMVEYILLMFYKKKLIGTIKN